MGTGMAHTPRRKNDSRVFAIVMKPGTRIGLMTHKGPVYGVVNSVDEGNWIYPSFIGKPLGVQTPSWCRASQVFLAEQE